MNETLYLPIKGEWLQLILAGIKNEEYRKKSDYWRARLFNKDGSKKQFKYLCFHNYKTAWWFKNNGLRSGKGNRQWGAPDEEVFIISIGDFLEESTHSKKTYAYVHRQSKHKN